MEFFGVCQVIIHWPVMEEGLAHGDQAEEGLQLEGEVKGGQRDVTLLTSDPSGIKAQRATE